VEESKTFQSSDGYKCVCGEWFSFLNEFRTHVFRQGRMEPGAHKSAGRCNVETGEITMPPWKDRTREQRENSMFAQQKEVDPDDVSRKKKKKGPGQATSAPMATTNLASAMQVKFVPRIYTIDYSPILRAAQDASINLWGWRVDMPLGNFIDTVCYLYFKEKGVTLTGYTVEETDEEREERLLAMDNFHKSQEKEQKHPEYQPEEHIEEEIYAS